MAGWWMSHLLWLDLAVLNPEQGPRQLPPARPGHRAGLLPLGWVVRACAKVQGSAPLLCDLRDIWEAGLCSLPGRS